MSPPISDFADERVEVEIENLLSLLDDVHEGLEADFRREDMLCHSLSLHLVVLDIVGVRDEVGLVVQCVEGDVGHQLVS